MKYEWCNEGVIETGECPPGTYFDENAEIPDCYDAMEVESCNIDECSLAIHDCHIHGICTDIVGSFECSCPAGFIQYKAGEGIGHKLYANDHFSISFIT